jgi:hypothetical protein
LTLTLNQRVQGSSPCAPTNQTKSLKFNDEVFAIIALGFKRYGFDAEAAQIAHDISKAASYFRLNQLPELYTVPAR